MRPYADLPTISTYNGIYREPYDFLFHPIAPCDSLIVAHNPRRETSENSGTIGFYFGPSLEHYRSYRCLTSNPDQVRILDNIILYPASLVLPSRTNYIVAYRLYRSTNPHSSNVSTTHAIFQLRTPSLNHSLPFLPSPQHRSFHQPFPQHHLFQYPSRPSLAINPPPTPAPTLLVGLATKNCWAIVLSKTPIPSLTMKIFFCTSWPSRRPRAPPKTP
jgi:hypothetical protein